MAETVVNLVLEKITDAAVKEVLHLWRVDKEVEKVKHELEWVQAFLKDADRKRIEDETQKKWVEDIREVGYRIEDVIDTFLCEVPQKKPNAGKCMAIKRMFRKTKKLPVIHKLGDEIKEILETLQEIRERKEKYSIKNFREGSGGSKRLPFRPPVLPDIEDQDVVGLDVDKDNIIKELLDKSTPRRSVVSIVGQGGLGKTTLAKKVYNSNEIQRAFDIRIWVAISQEFELIKVLRKIRKKIRRIDESEKGKGEEYFLTDLFQSLKDIKYLLIIDDVWSTNLWMAIEKALPNKRNGSRILMTTRIHEVAKEADPIREPYKLSFLTEESSLELLLQKAIPNREINNECSDLAKQFVKKCGGLPLALVVLGGLLAKKQQTHFAWSKVLETMNWHANEQKRCIEIISTSYYDLPLAVKSCFMYFAAFPQDHYISAKSLLRMWIAEGFIPQEEDGTLEETAESFLEDLTQRSMIQVSARSLDSASIITCRIHDLLRDVAIQKAKEANFLTVCSTFDGMQSCARARRVAVHNFDCSEMMKYASPNLRTLVCYNTEFPNCSGHRLLKVLSIDYDRDTADIKWIEELPQLRYLEVTRDVIKPNRMSFHKLIHSMKLLQTLDLNYEDKSELDLPDCIWHIKSLRHVILPTGNNFSGPPAATDLPNLQTLRNVKSHESWDYTNLPNLPNLRQLVIKITEGFPWGLAASFLHTSRKLVALGISGQDIPTEIVDMKEFPFYQHLTKLWYDGRLSCHDFDVTMFPTHLTYLGLENFELQQDHMTVLEKLQGLKDFRLKKAYANQTMRCSAGGFPRLQVLIVWELEELEKWEIEEGAMPMLKYLGVYSCPMLQVPHGLQHLNNLKRLTWALNGDDESAPLKAKEIRHICKHVPSIYLGDLEENFD